MGRPKGSKNKKSSSNKGGKKTDSKKKSPPKKGSKKKTEDKKKQKAEETSPPPEVEEEVPEPEVVEQDIPEEPVVEVDDPVSSEDKDDPGPPEDEDLPPPPIDDDIPPPPPPDDEDDDDGKKLPPPPTDEKKTGTMDSKVVRILIKLIPHAIMGSIAFLLAIFFPFLAMLWAFGFTVCFAFAMMLYKGSYPTLKSLPRISGKWVFIIGTYLFMMLLVLNVVSSTIGLALPSGQNPTSFPKYVSILVLIPRNLIRTTSFTVFPGHPFIIVPALILMTLGVIAPARWIPKILKLLSQTIGIILLTIAPIISIIVNLGKGSLSFSYNPIFYIAWFGLFLQYCGFAGWKIGEKLDGTSKRKTKTKPIATAAAAAVLLVLICTISLFTLPISPDHILQAAMANATSDWAWEAGHHGIARGGSALLILLAILGLFESANEEIEEMKPDILELTFPAGRSPKVFQEGWVFGAKCKVNVGGEDEMDISDQVNWSGTGTFSPPIGSKSRPTFSSIGTNTITLKAGFNDKTLKKDFVVDVVSVSGYVRLNDLSDVPSDAHGCPACPHPCVGPIISGSPNVIIHGYPAARVGDKGIHAACCGPNTYTIYDGDPSVLINGRPAATKNSKVQHCGGMGGMKTWAP